MLQKFNIKFGSGKLLRKIEGYVPLYLLPPFLSKSVSKWKITENSIHIKYGLGSITYQYQFDGNDVFRVCYRCICTEAIQNNYD